MQKIISIENVQMKYGRVFVENIKSGLGGLDFAPNAFDFPQPGVYVRSALRRKIYIDLSLITDQKFIITNSVEEWAS